MPEVLAQMGGAFRDPGIPETLPNPTRLPPGMLVPGNINLQGRPLHISPRGEEAFNPVASEYSYSFGDEKGREILVPTVVNGRFLTPTGERPPKDSPEEKEMYRRAQKRYEETGEHMGIFTPTADRKAWELADAYAQQVHLRPMNLRGPVYQYQAPSSGYLRQLYSRFGGGE